MSDISLDLVQSIVGQAQAPLHYTFTEHDTVLYALGVGAPHDATNSDELKFVYELHPNFCALPTMPVIYSGEMIHEIVKGDIQGIKFNPMMLVHGEQAIDIKAPLPVAGMITCTPTISNIYDKGSGMVIETTVRCVDTDGTELATTTSSMFIRGLGGFGGERGTSQKITMPERQPDAIVHETTLPQQALLYRLSGDINPLHADPDMAKMGNFERPILHGLASYGFAGRAILKHFADNQPERLRSMRARFSREVYPGDTLTTELWQQDGAILFQTKVEARDVIVISGGKALLD